MRCKLEKRETLHGDRSERIHQALRKAGWYHGRKADISAVLEYYQQQGIELHAPAISFFEEYSGIASQWYISFTDLKKSPDFSFILFPQPPEYKTDVQDLMYDDPTHNIGSKGYTTVKAYAEEPVVMVGEIGCYYPAQVWIGSSGRIYCTHEYNDEVLSFDSVIKLIQHELSTTALGSVAMKP